MVTLEAEQHLFLARKCHFSGQIYDKLRMVQRFIQLYVVILLGSLDSTLSRLHWKVLQSFSFGQSH